MMISEREVFKCFFWTFCMILLYNMGLDIFPKLVYWQFDPYRPLDLFSDDWQIFGRTILEIVKSFRKGAMCEIKLLRKMIFKNVLLKYMTQMKKMQKYINKKLLICPWLRLINVPVNNHVKRLYFYLRTFLNNILVKVHY